MKLSLSIMAHVDRAAYLPDLAAKLGAVPVSMDERKGAPGHLGVWKNCRRAWTMHDPAADYHAVIQDDAIICNRFRERAEDFLERFDHATHGKRDRAFSFYFGNKAMLKHLADEGMRTGFVVKKVPGWGVAICLPVSLIPDMLAVCDTYRNPQDDVRIGKFLAARTIETYYPMPSLVDHRPGTKSLVADPGPCRKAWYFIDTV